MAMSLKRELPVAVKMPITPVHSIPSFLLVQDLDEF
jgi:hypothetical protein